MKTATEKTIAPALGRGGSPKGWRGGFPGVCARLALAPLALLAALLGLAGLLTGCGAVNGGKEQPEGPPLFTRRAPSETGVTFANELPETADFNILNYLYYYNGGGVAAGDVNGDGRPDLYFTSNLGANRLYLNRGGFRFEDVTDAAGVAGTGTGAGSGAGSWTTGATMADVNGDGRLDLYVSVVNHLGKTGANQLFINQGVGADGVPTFIDEASAYGLDFAGYSTQAAFFDYDRDGDLDAYLLNHALHTARSYRRAHTRMERDPKAGDRLLRNEDGHFVDVSAEAGIFGGAAGYGLSVSVSDVNRDGWPDLYVANDFHENDFLYLNQHDGTFREALEESAGHTSQFSMGTDAADVNGDGWPDLATLDMLPADEAILKTSASAEPHDVYRIKRGYGYHPQLSRNTLQLNRGRPASDSAAQGSMAPGVRFSEIGALAGMEATDWSWSALFADLDLDGRQDLFVTNGIYRRPNDLDYINYVSNDAIAASLEQGITEKNLSLLKQMPQIPIPNAAFRNGGALTFTDEAAAWGLDHEGFSNGATYADLDGDGDLDLAVNNLGEAASLYENRAMQRTERHFLEIELNGSGKNTAGLGAAVLLWQGATMQLREQHPVRGWQSSVAPRLHFGLGADSTADSLTVVWPDGRFQTLRDVPGDQVLTLHQADAAGAYRFHDDASEQPPLFEDVTAALGLDTLQHEENAFIDFNRDALMPHKLSTEGPALAVGDVNGDGLDDAYLGGAKHQSGRLLVQQSEGRFALRSQATWRPDRLHEDTDAAFFDADGDGHLDLYVVSGGGEFWGAADALRDRLYLGDGAGGFRRADGALPDFYENGAVVAPADYDGDGDTDLFVGSRLVAKAYGATPESYLLENDGAGRFADVTAEVAPALTDVGMVTDAVWADADGSGTPDLVVVGEWMPVRVFTGRDGRLTEQTEAAGLGASQGWWNSVAAADLDGDGDVDLALGNLGRNTRLAASAEAPARLYVRDFDGNGSADPILTYYRDGASYPMATRDELVQQIGPLRQKFPTYAAFGAAQMSDLFTPAQIQDAQVRTARTFATAVAENRGGGAFALRALPVEAQFAPVYALLPGDFDEDGRTDLLLGGNFYGVKPALGRYDASYGLFLRGTDEGFISVPPPTSTLWLTGEVRAVRRLRQAGGATLLLVARNDASLRAVRVRPNTSTLAELE